MKCVHVQQQIILFRELSNLERVAVLQHLQDCESCKEYFESMQAMEAMIREVSRTDVMPPDSARLTNRIMDKIMLPDSGPSAWIDKVFRFPEWNHVRWAMAGISFFMLALFAIEVMRPMKLDSLHAQVIPLEKQTTSTLNAKEFQNTLKRYASARSVRRSECTNPFAVTQQNGQCILLRRATFKTL